MKEFYEILSEVNEPWAITGGANHYMRGIVDYLNDIDIITSKRGGAEISRLLSGYTVLPNQKRKTGAIESSFAQYLYQTRNIEVMGDPVNFFNGAWCPNTVWSNNIEQHFVDGCSLFLTSIEYEKYIYKLLENDERVSLLVRSCLKKPGRGTTNKLRL